jgi:hypothetical protein
LKEKQTLVKRDFLSHYEITPELKDALCTWPINGMEHPGIPGEKVFPLE